MKSLRFTLSGKTGFFKIPEVNAIHYFTYGNIHKPALLGILGAVEGYGGYTQQKERGNAFPEYYERLRKLGISIVPLAENGYFEKKIQQFNNSVGYASGENGGNLIVSEQWLEEPAWTVYVRLDCPEAEKVADRMMRGNCIYVPYLGKNDHPASITDVEVVELEAADAEGRVLDCLAPADVREDDGDYDFRYQEYLPVELEPDTNQYISRKFILTDAELVHCDEQVYGDKGRHLVFY